MTVPGSNLLTTALRVIGRQSFQYIPYLSREKNSIGQFVTAFGSARTLTGSVQAVPRNLYEQYGLEFNRSYMTFFMEKNAIDVTRDVSGDQFIYACKKYQALSKTPWYAADGWISILCVEIPADAG